MQIEDSPRSEASPARRRLEQGLWALALVALAAALWLMISPARPGPVRALSDELAAALPEWSLSAPPHAHLHLGSPPEARIRDWLAALARTGASVSWRAAPEAVLSATAVAVEPLADPRQPLRVWAASQSASAIEIDESSLAGDPAPVALLPSGAGVAVLPSLTGAAILRGEGLSASATLRDRLELRPVMLLGRASWEARFVAAALEEHGWRVDARLMISPGQIIGESPRSARPDGKAPSTGVGRGAGPGGGRGGGPGGGGPRGEGPAPQAEIPPSDISPREAPILDPDHYAAVILLDDSAAAHAAAISTFVEAGGGALAMGDGASVPALNALLPAAASGLVQEAAPFAEDGDALPRDMLELRPLLRLRDGAHVVERRGEDVAVAIHRRGEGRVAQVGYADLWRWRMASPDDDAPKASRLWLAGLLAMVAHAPRADLAADPAALSLQDPAPLAAWRAAFGPPEAQEDSQADLARGWSERGRLSALFVLAACALLGMWLSRRLRGCA